MFNKILTALFLINISCVGNVLYFNDPTYERDEPTDPPWFISNNKQPSKLYHNGAYVSQEFGTNDLGILDAWKIHSNGVSVGVVDVTTHGLRVSNCVAQISPNSLINFISLSRFESWAIAGGISNAVQLGCRVITLTEGYSTPDNKLLQAIDYARSSNSIVCCSVPNIEENLDNSNVIDYPYDWYLPNVLPVSSSDRNGNHYNPSAIGTNCIMASGRNIVARYGNETNYSSGTSYACPIAAGCLAILTDRYPKQSYLAYLSDIRATLSGGRINLAAALEAPRPILEALPTGIVVHGLSGWEYEIEYSQDLINWQYFTNTVDGALIPVGLGFYRGKVP